MSVTIFRLYRINFVDRQNLFEKPVVTNEDVFDVFLAAAHEKYDIIKSRPRSGVRWSIRDVSQDNAALIDRPYVAGIFSHETTYKRGPIVIPEGVVFGTSEINPPMASPVRFYIDLTRHIVAIEDVPSIMQQKTGWQKIFQLILNSAAHGLNYTSRVDIEPIAPRQIVEERLRSFDRITRLRLTLRIPNPDLMPEFKKLFDELEESGIRELTEDMRSERGLKMEANSIPRMSIDMAMNGYRKGSVHVYGQRNGRAERFTIADDVARIDLRDLRSYVEGMETAADKRGEKRLLKAIIERIDETLSGRSESN
jgi:hypothetical protein